MTYTGYRVKLKNGEPSAYGFCCGMVQKYYGFGTYVVELWHEHGSYHVRATGRSDARAMWKCCETVKEARAYFAKLKVAP